MKSDRRLEAWDTIPLKYVCKLNPPVSFDDLGEDDYVTFLPMDRVKAGYFLPNVDKVSGNAASYNVFEEGDILLAKVTPCFENGNIAIAENLMSGRGFGSSELFVLRPTGVLGRFLFYSLQSPLFKQEGEASMTGAGGLKRVSPDVLRQYRIVLPNESTQKAIADYLDRETARLDALIAAKERLLCFLGEKRQALITRAVTRGLDRNAPLRNSDIPWLGPIPAHWEVKRMKYLFQLRTDQAPEDNDYELLSLYTDVGVKPRKELEARGNKATTTDRYWMVSKGDFIVNKLLAWMGAFGVSEFDGVTSPAYDVLRPQPGVRSSYYHHLFRCGIAIAEIKRRSYGIMDMRLRLYFDQFGDMRVPVPPVDDQEAIVAQIEEECVGIEALSQRLIQTISLIQERRSALIAAAVTGQIQVA